MRSSNSVWGRKFKNRIRSAAFSLKPPRIGFSYGDEGLGSITFNSEERNLNESRQEVIDKYYEESTLNGYKYPSISHSHVKASLLNGDLEVLSHGVPVKQGWENCSMLGITCSEGDSNVKCNPGKCVIGRISKEGGVEDKWKYESYSTEGLHYYVYGKEYINLQPVLRGEFILPGGVDSVSVTRMASPSSTIYLPPSTYSGETFTRRVIRFFDPDSFQDSVNIFTRSLLGTEFISISTVQVELYEKVVETIASSLPSPWHEVVTGEIKEVWLSRYTGTFLTNRDFLVNCYGVLGLMYTRAIQVAGSSFRVSTVELDEDIARPVYNRLPGVSGAYNSEDSESNVSSWLVSGADMELSNSKTLIDGFYRVFLDHETCYPLNLDWIAQHMGLTAPLWDIKWRDDVKRIILRNAHKNGITPDGNIWITDSEQSTLRRIDFSYIESTSVDEISGLVSTSGRYKEKIYDPDTELVSLQDVDSIRADITNWQGLLPSRGSLISILFMFWVFGIKAPSGEEFEFVDGAYRVKSGLRQFEFDAPVNMPVRYDVLHVGSEDDLEIGNYSNQLVADVGVFYDVNKSNTMVLRMPFYYNRNGVSWDAAESIMENWVPGTAVKRVQYGYAVADLLRADDLYFSVE
jgi:hypothetical protein